MYNVPTSERILLMAEPKSSNQKPKPFLQRIQLKGKSGTVVRATGQIDDGAMRNCISLRRWERYGHCLDALTKSNTVISVANATEIKSIGSWTGTVQVGGTGAPSCFEIFDCKNAFDVILGKPWLKAVRAQHNYVTDEIVIGAEGEQEVITNMLDDKSVKEANAQIPLDDETPTQPTVTVTDASQQKENIQVETTADHQLTEEWARIAQVGASDTPRDEVRHTNGGRDPDVDQLTKIVQSETRIKQLMNHMDILREMAIGRDEVVVDTCDETAAVDAIGDVTTEEFKINRGSNTSARVTNAFDEARVQEILKAVEIGPDLTEDQREQVRSLVREYADVFALSLSEVLYVDWYKHKINIDPEQIFPTRINQRPITEGQKEWFHNILDDMEKSYVIQKVPGDFIKNLSSTNLAPKDAGKTGLTRTEVLRQVNLECTKNGLPPFWEQIPDDEETSQGATLEAAEDDKPTTPKTKWRVCHAFNALNKATQVPPFPAGDLRTKQEFAAGHRWASVIDFAAGYYAVPLDDDTVPYVAFYVEGRGYYVYLRMPFGLTGAPATFCEMVAIALDDMIGRELVNWMDDICLPGDVFETKLSNLRKFFH